MKIANHQIGVGAKAFIIAEIAQAHDGSLGLAHSFIDAIADSGADAVKFQTHIADAESTKDEPFRIPMSGQDATRWDYWKRMEFTKTQWADLAEHAVKRGLVFLSSPFSVAAVNMLADIGMTAWKVGSGEVFNEQLMTAMASKGGPILISSGMSSYDEIEVSYKMAQKFGAEVALFQCTSSYPVPLEKVGLNVLFELRQLFSCPIGLSDHSGTIYPSLFALAQGIDLIEVHATFNKKMYGPDATSSLTFDELAQIVQANQAFQVMRENPVDKNSIATELAATRKLFTKSVALSTNLDAGVVLTLDNLTLKKPGTGIPADQLHRLLGLRLVKTVPANRLLSWDDIESNL